MSDHYCLRCGHKMTAVLIDQFLREKCERCGWIFYPQIKVSAGGMICVNHKLLLVRRAVEPWKDAWYLPAGFMEECESPAQTAEREILEETGLIVKAVRLNGVYHYVDDPRGDGILILYDCDIVGGRLQITTETTGANFFSKDEIPALLAGSAHYEAVEKWIQSSKVN